MSALEFFLVIKVSSVECSSVVERETRSKLLQDGTPRDSFISSSIIVVTHTPRL